jgi:transcriptional regulator with XRE-family HTH domain
MKLNNIVTNPEFDELFQFKNEEEKLEHDAQMISYRILSEIEKMCDEKKIKKKDLAQMTGTSKSYITQLFNGTKSINTNILAKFEHALEVTIEIKLKNNEDTYEEFWTKQVNSFAPGVKRFNSITGAWYHCEFAESTNDIVKELQTESKYKQVAS